LRKQLPIESIVTSAKEFQIGNAELVCHGCPSPMAACRTGPIFYATFVPSDNLDHLGRSVPVTCWRIDQICAGDTCIRQILDSKSLHPRWMRHDSPTLNANFAPIWDTGSPHTYVSFQSNTDIAK
jgi:hypothetical protein